MAVCRSHPPGPPGDVSASSASASSTARRSWPWGRPRSPEGDSYSWVAVSVALHSPLTSWTRGSPGRCCGEQGARGRPRRDLRSHRRRCRRAGGSCHRLRFHGALLSRKSRRACPGRCPHCRPTCAALSSDPSRSPACPRCASRCVTLSGLLSPPSVSEWETLNM